jgi:hypothetical protein
MPHAEVLVEELRTLQCVDDADIKVRALQRPVLEYL